MSPLDRAEAALLAIWPDGERCGHASAREAFAALREARQETVRLALAEALDESRKLRDQLDDAKRSLEARDLMLKRANDRAHDAETALYELRCRTSR